jgi:hypothetical protein
MTHIQRVLGVAYYRWTVRSNACSSAIDIRCTLQIDHGDLLYVRSHGVRYGGAEVLARLGRGADVGASEYMFRMSTQVETRKRTRIG